MEINRLYEEATGILPTQRDNKLARCLQQLTLLNPSESELDEMQKLSTECIAYYKSPQAELDIRKVINKSIFILFNGMIIFIIAPILGMMAISTPKTSLKWALLILLIVSLILILILATYKKVVLQQQALLGLKRNLSDEKINLRAIETYRTEHFSDTSTTGG